MERHVADLQTTKEHIRRSSSKKGFEEKNCSHYGEEEEVSVGDAERFLCKTTSGRKNARKRARIVSLD